MTSVAITCRRCNASAERSSQSRSLICLPCISDYRAEGARAVAAVSKAIKRGEIQPPGEQLCVDCGKQARDHDHRDYTKPLEVAPVCRSCNQKRGQAFDSLFRPSAEELAPSTDKQAA